MAKETSDLVPRATVEEMVRAYEAAEKAIREGCRLIWESEKALSRAFTAGTGRGIDFCDPNSRARHDFEKPDREFEHLREQIWGCLVDRLQIRQMMSLAKAKELRDWLDKEAGREAITVESVIGFFRYYVQNLETMLEEQVVEVYDFLRPRECGRMAELKTNSPYRLGQKVIVSGWVSCWKYDSKPRVNHYYQDHYVALQNVFQALDGQGSISKGYETSMEAAIGRGELQGETTYFKYKACKNGNLHLEFLRADLVERFNQIAGKRFLGKGSDDVAA